MQERKNPNFNSGRRKVAKAKTHYIVKKSTGRGENGEKHDPKTYNKEMGGTQDMRETNHTPNPANAGLGKELGQGWGEKAFFVEKEGTDIKKEKIGGLSNNRRPPL